MQAPSEITVQIYVDAKAAGEMIDQVASAFERFGNAEPKATAAPAFDVLVTEVAEALKGALRGRVVMGCDEAR